MCSKLSFAGACLLVFAAGPALAAGYPQADLLIEAAELTKPSVVSGFRFLDTRPREHYLAGHVPGALWVDHAAWAKAFTDGPELEVWQRMVEGLGIQHNTPVVIYDDGRARTAAHVWWILRYWGFEDVRLLNGGWKAWSLQGISTDRTFPVVGAERLKLRPLPVRLVSMDQMLELLQDRDQQIIDARSSAEFRGEVKTARRNGAMPSARHMDSSALIDPQTWRFKSAEDVTRLFVAAGIDPERPTITYCHSGDRAALMAFTLELMGARQVRNYYRGWAEWGNADDTPVVRGGRRQ